MPDHQTSSRLAFLREKGGWFDRLAGRINIIVLGWLASSVLAAALIYCSGIAWWISGWSDPLGARVLGAWFGLFCRDDPPSAVPVLILGAVLWAAVEIWTFTSRALGHKTALLQGRVGLLAARLLKLYGVLGGALIALTFFFFVGNRFDFPQREFSQAYQAKISLPAGTSVTNAYSRQYSDMHTVQKSFVRFQSSESLLSKWASSPNFFEEKSEPDELKISGPWWWKPKGSPRTRYFLPRHGSMPVVSYDPDSHVYHLRLY
jgi:hypothetical protein